MAAIEQSLAVLQPARWGTFLPEHTNAVSLLDRLLHQAAVVVTEGEPFRMKEAKAS